MTDACRHVLIQDAAALRALEHPWRALFLRCPYATPFQAPEWLLPWWNAFPDDKSLAVVAGYDDRGELVLLLPFCVMQGKLMFIGTGNSDHLDVLVTAPATLPVALAMLDPLPWDTCELHQLPAESPLLALPGPLAFTVAAADPCPVVTLPAPISEHFAKRLERSRRQLAKLGPLSFVHGFSDAAFATFCSLHRKRWEARGEMGVLDDRSRAFLHEVAWRLPEARLGVLRAGETPVAAYIGFLHGGVMHSYLGGFDPAFERIGIGNLLIAEAMAAAARDGAHTFDFLRGREAYKYRWGAVDRATHTWRRQRSARAVPGG